MPYGGVNMHPSVLPFYRGPAPLIRQLECGERVGGISVIELHPTKFDMGKLFLQWAFKIPDNICHKEFSEGAAFHGAHSIKLLLENYDFYRKSLSSQRSPKENIVVKHEIPPLPASVKILFNEKAVSLLPSFKLGKEFSPNDMIYELKRPTYAKMVSGNDGNLNWSNCSSIQIYNKWRAFAKQPACFTFMTWPPGSSSVKRVKIIEMKQPKLQMPEENSAFEPGTVLYRSDNILEIHTKNRGDPILVTQIQVEGKKIQDPKNFYHGYLSSFPDKYTKFHLGEKI